MIESAVLKIYQAYIEGNNLLIEGILQISTESTIRLFSIA